MLGEAAAVAFYALLALFPAMAALVWLCGNLGPGAGAAAAGTALWGGTAAAQLFGALNAAYGERESRGPLRLYGTALLFALGAGAFVLVALAAIAVPAALGAQAGSEGDADTVLRLGRWPVLLVAVSVVLALAYRHGPSRAGPRWRWVSWGGALAALAWLLGSAAFSFHMERVGGYDRVYGSLGAVVGLMTWAWLSSAAVLVGAALNAELEREAAV